MLISITNRKVWILGCISIGFLYIILQVSNYSISFIWKTTTKIGFSVDGFGWITSPSLYKDMVAYVNQNRENYKKRNTVEKKSMSYIQFIKPKSWPEYPFSTKICVNTSNQELSTGIEYCLLRNIYYNSGSDQYYFYQDSSSPQIKTNESEFDVPYGKLKINIINDLVLIKQLMISRVLTRPVYVGGPIDPNYAHGLLETYGPRFWVLSELHSRGLFVDPTKIQIYYTSSMFSSSPRNWELYNRQSDGTYRDTRKWSDTIQSMMSYYPLLTYKSFDGTTVMFKYFLITGHQVSRTPAWDYYYSVARSFSSHPFHTRQYRRAYLAYSEWLLMNLNLPSKFELTAIQQKLQQSQTLESFPICEQRCKPVWNNLTKVIQTEFSGEWIVVVNRAGSSRREIINADELVLALLKAFPDHTNPYLRVWPKPINFDADLYKTARLARAIRLLIGVHGAGLANTIFMRPGAILYEINPIGCRKLSFNFNRWATVFNLQHALWTPSQKYVYVQDDNCLSPHSATTLVTSEIVKEVINLIGNEKAYRNGYLRRALDILNDTSLSDYPQLGLEGIL